MIKKTIFSFFWILLINCFLIPSAFACRYIVREIGFTDLASDPYRIYFYTSHEMAEDKVEALRKISHAALLDANVQAEIVNMETQRDHPAMEYFQRWQESNPVAILVAPEDRSIVIPLDLKSESFKEAVWSAIGGIVSSPTQRRIVKNIIKAYSVVLFVEGRDEEANKKAKKIVTRAMKAIAKTMQQMPKPVDEPPQLMVIANKSVTEDKVLLWSLALNEDQVDEPVVAVLYGRGRRMGPLLEGDQITENAVYSLLSLVGADCECGLDRSWLLGKMIPLRWDSRTQTEVVKRLGFDTENPMVKTEMSQILSIAPSSVRRGEPLLGYSEGLVKFDAPVNVSTVVPSQVQELNSGHFLRINIILVIAVLGLLVMAVGGFILIRSKRRKIG